jgi:hypothetical protein
VSGIDVIVVAVPAPPSGAAEDDPVVHALTFVLVLTFEVQAFAAASVVCVHDLFEDRSCSKCQTVLHERAVDISATYRYACGDCDSEHSRHHEQHARTTATATSI